MTEASDATSTRRDTRAVAERLVGSSVAISAAAEKSLSIAARMEIVLGKSERPLDVELVQLAGEASTALSEAVSGLQNAARAAYGYLAETL